MEELAMHCFQCQETNKNSLCDIQGICGKTPEVAALQDLLIHQLKGLAWFASQETVNNTQDDRIFLVKSIFATLTNVNFEISSLTKLIKETTQRRDNLLAIYTKNPNSLTEVPALATWSLPEDYDALLEKAKTCGVNTCPVLDEDRSSLRELLIYGLKGLAAYAEHAAVFEACNQDLFAFVEKSLAFTLDETHSVEAWIAMTMECGKWGVEVMALLDEAHTDRYGHPRPVHVATGLEHRPGILVSGHDLRDLEDLLEQTKDKGIDVYTHGEMLPAHGYPAFQKYNHLKGNWGKAWWQQQKDFADFGGPIIMTTNCIQKPKKSYEDRIYTTGMVGWDNIPHIEDRQPEGRKDFSAVIEKALACGPLKPQEGQFLTTGFAHNAILEHAETVLDAIKAGQLKRFVVMAGCDGRHKERSYYTDFAQALPHDSIILTAGCAKYRYNHLDLGTIGGLPRMLDAGQCNDSYSLVKVALTLAEALDVSSVNDLPIYYNIAWYEQKAVLVLLALLHLGVKNIHLGPTLPAFLSPNVTKVLVDSFGIAGNGTVEQDLVAALAV